MTKAIQAIWATDGADAQPLAYSAMHSRDRALNRSILLRDVAEYFAAGVVIATFFSYAINAANWIIASGSVLVVLGTLAVMIGLWPRRPLPVSTAVAETHVAYLRAQLVRQRDAVASVSSWYLAPAMPGLMVLLAGYWVDQAPRVGTVAATIVAVVAILLLTAAFALIWEMNNRAAHAYQKEIEVLDRIQTQFKGN